MGPNASGVLTRRHMLKKTLVAGGAVAGSGALATVLQACGGGGQSAQSSTVSAKQVKDATGSINVLTYTFYQVPELNSGPVTAKFTAEGSTSDVIAKVRSPSSGLEVMNSGPSSLVPLYALERLVPIETELIPRYGTIDPTLSGSSTLKHEGKVYAVPFMVSIGLAAWDGSVVPEPTSSAGLLGSAYKGSIGVVDESDTLITFAELLGFDITHFTTDNLEAVMSYLEELKPNIRTLYAFGEEVQLFGRKDIAVALWSYGSLVTEAQKVNPDVKGNLLASNSYVDCWSVLEGSDMAAALSWIDGTLSVESQRALSAASGSLAVVEKAHDPSLLPPELRQYTLAELLEKSPINVGVPLEGEGLVTRDIMDNAWSEFTSSF